MEFNITAKNLKITTGIRDYINKKIAKVISDFEHPVNCDIILAVEKNRQLAELIISGDTGRFCFKKTSDDLYKAIDLTFHAADITIKKFKSKQKDHKTKIKPEVIRKKIDNAKKRKDSFRNIRVRRIEVKDIKPMTDDEALMQLKYIKQNILVYQNAKNFLTHVLYRKKDGFNLIKPKDSIWRRIFTFKKKQYVIEVVAHNKKKINVITRRNALFRDYSYQNAIEKITKTRELNYLIFKNTEGNKINIVFRINKHLLGYHEFK